MNLIDIARLVSVYVMILAPAFSSENSISFLVYLVTWIKLPKNLQVFDGTRRLLYLTYQTMYSILAFLVYLTLAIFAYGHLMHVICLSTPKDETCTSGFLESLVLSFGLLFSQMENYTQYPPLKLFLLIVFAMIIPTVLINLLIAIMSKTYANLSNWGKACDLKCLAEMLIE